VLKCCHIYPYIQAVSACLQGRYILVYSGSECLLAGLVYISINRQQLYIYSAGIHQCRKATYISLQEAAITIHNGASFSNQ
jgi:hypothetical protein